jgi:hypothetical protein
VATKKKKKPFAPGKATARKKPSSAARAKPATTKPVVRKPIARKVVKTPVIAVATHKPLPGVFRLTAHMSTLLYRHWRLFIGITLVYTLLNLLFVHGFGNGIDINGLKNSIENNRQAHSSKLATSVTLFSYLLTSNGATTTNSGGVYQTLFVILVSLALVWALREAYIGAKVRIRDAYYKSTYPLVPFLVIMFVIALETVPLLIAAWVATTILGGGYAVTFNEKAIVISVSSAIGLTSLYLLSSSVFALYIVTLPDMMPMRALRAARKLVKKRRWLVMRKLLFLPLLLIVVASVIMLPFLLAWPQASAWVYFGLTMFVPLIIHGYFYSLYREMI